MTQRDSHPPTQHCLVGVDGSALSKKAFQTACELVRGSSAQLSALAVIHSPALVMAEPEERRTLIEHEKKRLSELLADWVNQVPELKPQIQVEVMVGEPSPTLLQHAKAHGVDHIVLGHRSTRSITQWLLGSVAKAVLDGAHCTVTVVR